MNSSRIFCLGSNLESKIALQGLVSAGVPIAGLITRPSGSPGGASDYVDLHEFCAAQNISTIDTTDVNNPNTLDCIASAAPDYIFVLGWSQLLGARLLELPGGFCVGSHPSALPEGRGRAPVPWTILQGLRETAVTLFKMELDADAGDILWQERFDIAPDIYALDLYMQIAHRLAEGFGAVYRSIISGSIKPQKQDLQLSSYREKRYREDGWLDFNSDAATIDRLIRAVSHPFPGAYSYHKGRKIEIWKADLTNVPEALGTPGQILAEQDGTLLVQAADKPIWISDLSCNGSEIDAATLPKGSYFGYRVHDEIHKLWEAIQNLRENK